MEMPVQLSLEQQFKLQILRDQVRQLSLCEAQDYLLELFRQAMVKDIAILKKSEVQGLSFLGARG